MKNTRFLHVGLTVISCVLMVTLGWVYLVNGTTIGANITTVDLSATGLTTLDGLKFGTTATTSKSGNIVYLTAANVCDNSIIEVAPTTTTSLVSYTPTAAALIADCLTTVGAYKDLYIRNTSANIASSTYWAASTGISTVWTSASSSASSTLTGGGKLLIKFVRTTEAAVDAIMFFGN